MTAESAPGALSYMPVFMLRPAEMMALDHLSDTDKERILPLFLLKPWLSAKSFGKSIEKIEAVYGKDRIWIGDLDPHYRNKVFFDREPSREAVSEFTDLVKHEDGFANWCSFVERHSRIIPCIQMHSEEASLLQLQRFTAMKRGAAFRIAPENRHLMTDAVMDGARQAAAGGRIYLIVDYGAMDTHSDLPELFAAGRELAEKFLSSVPSAIMAFSATSFPSGFADSKQDIMERRLFSYITRIRPDIKPVYSDRASARIPDLSPRGAPPRPRVDLATKDQWLFFKAAENSRDSQRRNELYKSMARLAVSHEEWDDSLKAWGMKMITGLAAGASSSQASPMRITAYRINIHLRRQIYYHQDHALTDAREMWQD